MNRRDFFKFAVAAGAVLALPDERGIWQPESVIPSPNNWHHKFFDSSKIESLKIWTAIEIRGYAAHSRHAFLNVRRRTGKTICTFSINAAGGYLHWGNNPFDPGSWVACRDDEPVIECSDPDVDWHVLLKDIDQRDPIDSHIGGLIVRKFPSSGTIEQRISYLEL